MSRWEEVKAIKVEEVSLEIKTSFNNNNNLNTFYFYCSHSWITIHLAYESQRIVGLHTVII